MAALVVLPANGRAVLRFPAVCKGHVNHTDAGRTENVDAVLRRCGGVAIKIVATDGSASAATGTGASPAEVFGAELVPGARYVVGYTHAARLVASSAADKAAATKTVQAQHWDGGSGVEVLAREPCGVRLETADGSELGARAIAAWMHHGNARVVPPTAVGTGSLASLGNRWIGDLSALLKARRVRARAAPADEGALGPRVLVCGSARGAGKTTVCRTLANYAARDGYHPLLVSASLDGALGGVAPPTFIGATVVQHAVPADDDAALFLPSLHCVVGLEPTRGGALVEPSSEPSASPAMDGQTFAANDPAHRAALTHALHALLAVAEARTVEFDRTRCGGILVDAPADDGGDGYVELLLSIIEECGIDVIVFIGGSATLRARLRSAALQKRREVAAEAAAALPDASMNPQQPAAGAKEMEDPAVALATSHATLVTPQGEVVDCFHTPAVAGAVARLDRDRRAAERGAWRGYFLGSAATRLQPVAVSLFSLLRGPHRRGESAPGAVAFVRLLARSSAGLDGMLPIGEEESARRAGATVSAQQVDEEELLRMLQARIEGGSAASANALGSAGVADEASGASPLGVATVFMALSAHVPTQRRNAATAGAAPQLGLDDLDSLAARPQSIGAVAVCPAGRTVAGTEWKVVSPSPLPFVEAQAVTGGSDDIEPVLCFYVLEGAHGGTWLA